MSKTTRRIVVFIIALLIVVAGVYFLNPKSATAPEPQTSSSQAQTDSINLIIKADGEDKTYPVEAVVGQTVLVATEKATTVVKTGEGKDAFITSINGREADTAKKEFWKLVINGEDAQVGAGTYIIKSGDDISWEIDT